MAVTQSDRYQYVTLSLRPWDGDEFDLSQSLTGAAILALVATHAQTQSALLTKGAEAPVSAAGRAEAEKARQLTLAHEPWTGDFDKMLERRMIRVYAPYSRSLYFVDKGRERGIAAELVRDFERWVNQKYAKQLGKRPLTIYIVAATRDKLITDLRDGLADIAVGNLTVTDERRKVVDFVAPDDEARQRRDPRHRPRVAGDRRRRRPCRARPSTCARRRAITRALRR